MRGKRGSLLLPAGALLLLAIWGLWPTGCGNNETDEPTFLQAKRVTSWSELIGGPDAYGTPGDFLLENNRIRVVIKDVGESPAPGLYGGSILDADRVRRGREYCCGHGLDQFQEFFPTVNTIIPEVIQGAGPPLSVRVLDDGAGGGQAVIRVEGVGAPLLTLLKGATDYVFQVDYVLRPNRDYVEVQTTVDVNPRSGEYPTELGAYLSDPVNIFEQLLTGNLILGDALFFGTSLKAFGPDFGFYLDGIIWEMFMQDPPGSTLSTPIRSDFIAGVGDGISYGVTTKEGNIQLPLFTSSIALMLSSVFEQARVGNTARVAFTNYFIVGEGDVASVLDTAQEIRGIPTGRLEGKVVDAYSYQGISAANVFVFKDPRDPTWKQLHENWFDSEVNPENQEISLESLLQAVLSSNVTTNPRVSPLLSQIETDRFEDASPDGSFHCRLEPGRYLLLAHTPYRPEGKLLPVTIRKDMTTSAELSLTPAGRVFYEVRDGANNYVPAKVTFQGTPNPSTAGERQACNQGGVYNPDCPLFGHHELFLGDKFLPNRLAKVVHTANGVGETTLKPGTYTYWASRGPEYTVDTGTVTVDWRYQAEIHATVVHAADSKDYLSFDIHQHSQRSHDSSLPVRERLVTNVAEQVEILNATDHDYITNFWPIIRDLDLERYIHAIKSDELTTVEMGHFIGFPLHWNPRLASNGAPGWVNKSPQQIFDTLRDGAGFGRQGTVVHVAHPRDSLFGYFYMFGMDPSVPRPDKPWGFKVSPDILGLLNPFINPSPDLFLGLIPLPDEQYTGPNFSLDFESLELLNAKRFELIRTPTVSEYDNLCEMSDMRHFIDERDCLYNPDGSEKPPGERKTTVYEIMTRTFAEQAAIYDGSDPLSSSYPQALEDWFSFLNQGYTFTATAGSDSHNKVRTEAGCPRTYLRSDADEPSQLTDQETAKRVWNHQAFVSYGPIVDLHVNGTAAIGDTIQDTDGRVRLRIRVETPGWYNVDRIEIYGNGLLVGDIGRDATEWAGPSQPQPMPDGAPPVRCVTEGKTLRRNAVKVFDDDVVCYLEEDPEAPSTYRDTWFVVLAMGDSPPTPPALMGPGTREDAVDSMFPVYTDNDFPYIQVGGMIFLAIQSLLDGLPIPGLTSKNPYTIFPTRPFAFTNPIWVDADGSPGFDPSGTIIAYYGPEGEKHLRSTDTESLASIQNPRYLRVLKALLFSEHPMPPKLGPRPVQLNEQRENSSLPSGAP